MHKALRTQLHGSISSHRAHHLVASKRLCGLQIVDNSSCSPQSGRSGPSMGDVAVAAAGQAQAPAQDPVVQYVVLRRDLWTELKWPLGSLVAQACHASTAAMWLNRDDDVTAAYLSDANLDHMHKVVLEIKGESQLRDLSAKLAEAGIKHKLWVEQPEDFVTCLATKPYPKSQVAVHFKKLQLCKAQFNV